MKIKKEINRLREVGFIYKIEHTEWVSPLVVVPKKNGKLRVCVIPKKVNAVTIWDHYPLPITDHVLERVAGAKAYSFLDGFSGYNQLSSAKDQHKMSFATERGTFVYKVMPFGLTNAPSTFQRLMCHIFKGLPWNSFGDVCWWFVYSFLTENGSSISTKGYIWEVSIV